MRGDPYKSQNQGGRAEETAGAILGWLASEPDMLGRFLALSGIQPQQLRSAVGDPQFLAGMIDFLMGHEPTLMAFCEATDTKPEDVASAWRHYTKPALDSGDY
jgi:hypothetical protein